MTTFANNKAVEQFLEAVEHSRRMVGNHSQTIFTGKWTNDDWLLVNKVIDDLMSDGVSTVTISDRGNRDSPWRSFIITTAPRC